MKYQILGERQKKIYLDVYQVKGFVTPNITKTSSILLRTYFVIWRVCVKEKLAFFDYVNNLGVSGEQTNPAGLNCIGASNIYN